MNVQTLSATDRYELEQKEIRRRKIRARIALEKRIVNRVIKTFLKDGCAITLSYGDCENPVVKSTKFSEFREHLMACDEEWLIVYKNGKRIGFVYFVYGNDGYDVICDYQSSLEAYMSEVDKYVNKIMGWENE